MKPLQFKVTNKEEYDDLMRTIERERPEVRWKQGGEKPTEWDLMKWYSNVKDLVICIQISTDNIISWMHKGEAEDDTITWKIGQSIPDHQLTALEELISIDQNKDGSITISPATSGATTGNYEFQFSTGATQSREATAQAPPTPGMLGVNYIIKV